MSCCTAVIRTMACCTAMIRTMAYCTAVIRTIACGAGVILTMTCCTAMIRSIACFTAVIRTMACCTPVVRTMASYFKLGMHGLRQCGHGVLKLQKSPLTRLGKTKLNLFLQKKILLNECRYFFAFSALLFLHSIGAMWESCLAFALFAETKQISYRAALCRLTSSS